MKYIIRASISLFVMGSISMVIYMGLMGKTRFSQRILTLLDPSYAKKYIPIIASVSEH